MKEVSGLVVHTCGGQHDTSAEYEGESERKIEEGDGSEARDDDAQARSEAFEDVVGVFDHQSSDETAKDLNEDRRPRPPSEVMEQIQPVFASPEVANDGKGSGYKRKERELDVPYPQVSLGVLQNHLEIDACQPRGAARDEDGQEPRDGIHQMGYGLPPCASHTL